MNVVLFFDDLSIESYINIHNKYFKNYKKRGIIISGR